MPTIWRFHYSASQENKVRQWMFAWSRHRDMVSAQHGGYLWRMSTFLFKIIRAFVDWEFSARRQQTKTVTFLPSEITNFCHRRPMFQIQQTSTKHDTASFATRPDFHGRKIAQNHPDPPRNHTQWIKTLKEQDKSRNSFIFYFFISNWLGCLWWSQFIRHCVSHNY